MTPHSRRATAALSVLFISLLLTICAIVSARAAKPASSNIPTSHNPPFPSTTHPPQDPLPATPKSQNRRSRRSKKRRKNKRRKNKRRKRRDNSKSRKRTQGRRKKRSEQPRCGTARLPHASHIAGGGAASWASTRRYNAALFSGEKRCSGALIAAEWVLTAAHCTLRRGDRVVVGGRSDASGAHRTVRALLRHPAYSVDGTKIVNDVMLVRLSAAVNDTPVLLNAAGNEPRPGTVVRATGYGRDGIRGARGPLKFVDLDVIGSTACAKKFADAGYTMLSRGIARKFHVCANHDDCDAGVCFGDSGGPLVARDRNGSIVQVGVTSYGSAECGSRETPDVYARVSLFQSWIARMTEGRATFVQLRARK